MITQQRREQILELLRQTGSVSVTELSARFEASESTIRRDLVALAELGKLDKVHGGAMLSNQEFMQSEATLEIKSLKNAEEKTRIAEYAASLIRDEDFVFIDAGSTTFLMTTFIRNTRASFVTNCVAHAKELAKHGCRAFIIGGEFKESTDAIIGMVAAQNMKQYNFSKAFVGANGVSEKQGYTTPDTDEGILKSIAIEKSFEAFVLADSTKFNKVSACTFASLDAAQVITTRCDNDIIKHRTVVKEIG